MGAHKRVLHLIPPLPSPFPAQGMEPISNDVLGLRHCNYIVEATPIEGGSNDFNFKVVNALNGACDPSHTPQSTSPSPPTPHPSPAGDSSAVSFQSMNYPTRHLSIITGSFAEIGRLGIDEQPDPYNASWVIVSGLADPTNFSLISQSRTPAFNGGYVTLSATDSGGCNYGPPSGDVYVAPKGQGVSQTWILGTPPPPPPPPAATVTVDTQAGPDHPMNTWFMGCHSDPGYTQEPRGWYSQLVYGESFEQGTTSVFAWNPIVTGATATVQLDSGEQSMNPNRPVPSLLIDYTSGSGVAGWSNRGIGNEGMSLVGGQVYEGYVIVLAPNGGSLYVGANDYTTSTLLASQTISLTASATWQQVNFSFTLSASTVCNAIVPGSDSTVDCGNMGPNPGHICVKCGGEFQVGLNAPGSIHVGYAYFSAGEWGRVPGLPVLKSAADTMQSMGITIIRQGGTVSQSFRWKDWRGAPWTRGSMQHVWGDSLVSGWGLFEFIDMCMALGIEPVVTLAYDLNNATDFADLVEYCYGDATTTWGATRINVDNHPAPYKIHTFELGNEQENPDYITQVSAMEARRAAVGAPPIFYMYPTNVSMPTYPLLALVPNTSPKLTLPLSPIPPPLPPTPPPQGGLSAAGAQAAIDAGLPIPMLGPDCHVGGGGGVSCAVSDFNALPNFDQGFINCETNDAISTMLRAIHEAADLQSWFNIQEPVLHRLRARTASFCAERSGHYDAFDQGISFFLPNMTWLQPPGYVHAMISQNWLPHALNVTVAGGGNGYPSTSAQVSDDAKTVIVQVVNPVTTSGNTTVTIAFTGGFSPSGSGTMWTLSDPGFSPQVSGNSPSNPTYIAPVQTTVAWPAGAAQATYPILGGSFTLFRFTAA